MLRRVFSALYVLLLLLCMPASAAPLPERIVLSRIDNDPVSDMAYQILQEAYRRLGIPLAAMPLPAERSLSYSSSGKTDGEVVRIAGLEKSYPTLVRVPEPLLEVRIYAFTTGAHLPVNGWSSLMPYRLCIRNGLRTTLQHTEGMRREITNSERQLFAMLRAGRCDMAILSHESWLLIDKLQMGPLLALEPALSSEPLYHYLYIRQAALAPKLARVLRDMKRDQTTQRIQAQFETRVQQARQRQSLP